MPQAFVSFKDILPKYGTALINLYSYSLTLSTTYKPAHGLALMANPYSMQHIFNVSALYYNKPIFYKISQISQYEYYAEPSEGQMPGFTLMKSSDIWISRGGYTEWLAAQIGEKIDKLHLLAIKN